jgi:hypothetical protein
MVDLARAPEESQGSYISRLSKNWGKLNESLALTGAENDQLRDALALSEEQMNAVLAEQEAEAKLSPVYVFAITQLFAAAATYIEERKTAGKPYVVVPTLVVSTIATAVAYLTGHGKVGDGFFALVNSSTQILNVRFSSKKGAEAREADQKKKKNEAPAPAPAEAEDDG